MFQIRQLEPNQGLPYVQSNKSDCGGIRADSLEDNLRLYTFTDGNRSRIAGATINPSALGQWHTMRVVALGSRIQVYLNDTLYIDHQNKTFTEGYVGLWTKADAVTDFDDLTVRGLPADGRRRFPGKS